MVDSSMSPGPVNPLARGEVTRLLTAFSAGTTGAEEALLPLIYEDLRRLARHKLACERADHTLDPTALVHEAWLRLTPENAAGAESRGHYYSLAARVMRQLLIDHARKRRATKRGGGAERVTLSGIGAAEQAVDILEIHDLLERLGRADEELSRIAELYIFGGLTQAEVSSVLDIPLRTLERRWRVASTWLGKELGT